MAVASIKESWSGIQWSGDPNQRQTIRVFTVETDTPGRGVFSFPISSGNVTIPAEGTAHPDLPEFISGVPDIKARGPTYFEIRVGYVAPGIAGGGGAAEQNPNLYPLDQPADVSWEDEDNAVAYDVDVEGKLVVNSNEEPFDPPLVRPVSDPVLVIERNEAGFDPDTKLDLQDTICTYAFWGAVAGRARMGKIRARNIYAAMPYWRVSYRIIFRMNTPDDVADEDVWKRQVLDQGTKYAVDIVGGETLIFETPNGEMVLLDEKGYQTDKANPHWLYFAEFKWKSWSQLGINNNEI